MDHVDAAFFGVESDAMPQTIAAVCLLQGHADWVSVRSKVESALQAFPRLLERVARHPYLAWRQDANFDLNRHIRTISVPHLQHRDDLFVEAARIASQPLDMSHPPWRLVLVTGGEPLACLVFCIHHGSADGVRVINFLEFISSSLPTSSGRESLEPETRLATARQTWWGRLARTCRCSRKLFLEALVPRVPTPLNGATSCRRAITPLDFPRRELTRIMRQADASLHDVLYGIVAGALGSYHQRQGRMVDSLRVIIPMAIPPTSWKGGLGNHLVLSALTLPLSELDARKRLRLVGDLFRRMKEDGTIGAYEFAAAVMDRFVPRWFHRRLWEAMIGRTNLVCTILPGPENVRYLGGARITGIYGVPAPVIGHGAAVAFVTYAGRICGSITTDLGVVPRSQELVECFDASYRQLLKDVTGETMSVHPLLGHPISLPDEDLVFEGSIHAGVGAHNRDAPRIVDYEKCPVGAPLEVLFAAGAIAQCGRSVTDMQCAAESVRSARDHRIELSSPLVLRDVNWQSHLAVSRCRVITIQTVVVKRGSSCRIQVSGLQEDESWRCLIVGQVEFGEAIPATEDACISEIRERCRRPVPICEFPKGFPDLEIVGICDSPLPCQLWRGESESLGMVEVPDAMRNGGYLFHPALLEASLQIGAMAFPDGLRERAARIKGVNSIHIDRRPGARVWIHSKFEYHRGRGTASVQWLTPEGQSIAWFQGLQWSPSEESPLEEHFGVDSNLGERIRHTPSDQRWELVSLHVRTQVADVLGWSWAEQIRVRDRFVDLGIDSMMAMELGLRLEQSTGLPLPHTLIFDYPTVEALTEYLLARTGIGVEAIAEPANLDEIPELSESDLAEMLLKELT